MPIMCPQCHQQVPTGQTVCPACQVDVLDILGTYAPFAALEPGQRLANRYEIVRYLGRGAMGMVYRAQDRVLDLSVALKILPPEVAGDRRAVAALKHEARTAMGLSHPSIMRVHQFEETQGHSFLVMEFIDGPTLADVLGRAPAGKLSLDAVVRYSQQICAGLAYAHEQGVIHRDLKPANIMLTQAEEVKVTDFGLAWVVQDRLSRLSGRPPVGTLAYMSPEQALGDKVDHRSDIYALGCVLYELLNGDPPFVSGDITYQHRYKPPAPIEGLPDGVNAVLLKALAKDPAQRWQSALEVQTALRDARAGGPAVSIRVAAPTQQGLSALHESINANRLLDKTLVNSIGMAFVLIPAGTFQMGSNDSEALEHEKPVHTVCLTQPFYLGKYEVTQGQWQAVIGKNPSHFRRDPNRPVDSVSWDDVQEFLRRLNSREGEATYRLPTEAEWEYAARAGTTTAYSFGDNPRQLGKYAWYGDNAGWKTHPVGQKKPNAWRLYDMHGNVWEWVQDWYGAYFADAAADSTGPSSGSSRVYRGGSWGSTALYCRSAGRNGGAPGLRYDQLGFRLLREVP